MGSPNTAGRRRRRRALRGHRLVLVVVGVELALGVREMGEAWENQTGSR